MKEFKNLKLKFVIDQTDEDSVNNIRTLFDSLVGEVKLMFLIKRKLPVSFYSKTYDNLTLLEKNMIFADFTTYHIRYKSKTEDDELRPLDYDEVENSDCNLSIYSIRKRNSIVDSEAKKIFELYKRNIIFNKIKS